MRPLPGVSFLLLNNFRILFPFHFSEIRLKNVLSLIEISVFNIKFAL